MKVDILGINFDNYTMNEAVDEVMNQLQKKEKSAYKIYTPNPEIVMMAKENKDFMNVLNRGNLVIPDGIGVVIGARIMKKNIPERVAGYDLVQQILTKMKNKNMTAYFLGSAKGIADEAARNMEATHQGLKVVGTHDGYFDDQEEKNIITSIKSLQPDLLLVGLGAYRQEKKWIDDHIEELGVKVAVGVGGSLDGMAGHVKRAPVIFQKKLYIEWLYRLIKQPSRAIRMLKLPLFLIDVIIHRKKN